MTQAQAHLTSAAPRDSLPSHTHPAAAAMAAKFGFSNFTGRRRRKVSSDDRVHAPRVSPLIHAGAAEQQARRQMESSERHGAAAACEAEKKDRREEDMK